MDACYMFGGGCIEKWIIFKKGYDFLKSIDKRQNMVYNEKNE